jgi:hypothetical protein
MLALGCAKQPATERHELDPALESRVLDSVPGDLPHRTFIDFEGKVHLLGYALSPESQAPPGSQLQLTLYWQSIEPLGRDWGLFTHILSPSGKQLANLDNVGPLRQIGPDQRQALAPSDWLPGKVYVDEQTFEVPRSANLPEFTIAVGIWRDNVRLDIVSGPSDGKNRGTVAHVPTGITRRAAGQTPES